MHCPPKTVWVLLGFTCKKSPIGSQFFLITPNTHLDKNKNPNLVLPKANVPSSTVMLVRQLQIHAQQKTELLQRMDPKAALVVWASQKRQIFLSSLLWLVCNTSKCSSSHHCHVLHTPKCVQTHRHMEMLQINHKYILTLEASKEIHKQGFTCFLTVWNLDLYN